MIRLPKFVTQEVFDWAIEEATKKKDLDFSDVEFITYDEGDVIQCMHVGSYDYEPKTIEKIKQFASDNNLKLDFRNNRKHHEIYLSDPRRTKPENLKTIIRIPVKKY